MSDAYAGRYWNTVTNTWESASGFTGSPRAQLWAWQPSSLSLQPVTMDNTGALVTSATLSGSAGNAAASSTGAGVPAAADYIGWNSGGTLVGVSVAAPLPVQITAAVSVATDTYSSAAGSVSGSGTIHATTGGKTLQLYYYMLNADPANAGPITVTLSFTSGATVTKVSLVPGAILARNVGAGKYYLAGAVSDNLLVSISGTGTLNWATEHKEV